MEKVVIFTSLLRKGADVEEILATIALTHGLTIATAMELLQTPMDATFTVSTSLDVTFEVTIEKRTHVPQEMTSSLHNLAVL